MTDIPIEDVGPPAPPAAAPATDQGAGEGWQTDKQGRKYVKAQARRGIIYRRGEETVAEALDRDRRPKDERPRASAGKRDGKTKPRIPDQPKDVDLRELEAALAQAFRSPAMVAGMVGDEYLANHFTMQGPALARNLVVASEHNPWLRRQLEGMAQGGDAAMTFISILGLAGALLAYAGPPIIYMFNLPVPDQARAMFAMPPRRTRENAYPPPQAVPTAA